MYAISYILMLVSKNAFWMVRAAVAQLAILPFSNIISFLISKKVNDDIAKITGLPSTYSYGIGSILGLLIGLFFVCYNIAWITRYAKRNNGAAVGLA